MSLWLISMSLTSCVDWLLLVLSISKLIDLNLDLISSCSDAATTRELKLPLWRPMGSVVS